MEGLHQDGSFPCGGTVVRVWKGVVEELSTVFLEPENGHFWVGCIYGKNNDSQRWDERTNPSWVPNPAKLSWPACLVVGQGASPQQDSSTPLVLCPLL